MQPLEYINEFPGLPADAANGCPHIVKCKDWASTDDADVDTTNLRVPDVVATILYNYNPNILRAFLDVYKHESFKFLRQELPDSTERSFVIIRKGGKIVVSPFRARGSTMQRAHDADGRSAVIAICMENSQGARIPMSLHGNIGQYSKSEARQRTNGPFDLHSISLAEYPQPSVPRSWASSSTVAALQPWKSSETAPRGRKQRRKS